MPTNALRKEFVEEWSSVFGAISHPVRLAILLTIYETDRRSEGSSVYFNDLCQAYGLDEPLMLYHLKKLVDAKLIKVRNADKVGPYYRVYCLQERGRKLLADLGLDKEILNAMRREEDL